ncbi:hypothetical protein ABGT15_05160 [Flavobacterium enshiense]|uniref:hypothetical protein n=1 Tax=Flavobacterium enshiense TaxID=1341165 RepID=UPI00345D060D
MRFLKGLLLCFVCLQIAFPFASENLLKFPILISHFSHHNLDHNKIDFLTFLKDHYYGSHHEEEHEEHKKLPFHHHADNCNYQILACNFEIKYFKPANTFLYRKPSGIVFYKNDFKPSVLLSIWKPPKIG